MEFSCKDIVKRCDFVLMEVIFFSCGVTNKVEEQFKEGSLMIYLIVFGKATVEYLENGLQSMLKENVGVVACD